MHTPVFDEKSEVAFVFQSTIDVTDLYEMAKEGLANDWHKAHYTSLARGGSGLVIVEATAVSPEGRITPNCLGLWNDAQADELRQIAAAIKAAGAVLGIQIAHAGRKASANIPWDQHLWRQLQSACVMKQTYQFHRHGALAHLN